MKLLPTEQQSTRLRTWISEAFWCDPTDKYNFKQAKLSIAREEQDVSWLDELFEGGIVLPDSDKNQALCIVITGPPGSGKSTLALEMVYRWAEHNKLTTAYVLTEAFAPWVLQNIQSLGWDTDQSIFRVVKSSDESRLRRAPNGAVILTDLNSLSGFLDRSVKDALLRLFGERPLEGTQLDRHLMPEVVVVDSLNTVDSTKRKEIYERLSDLISCGAKVLVLIGDSSSGGPLGEPWDFAADVVLRLESSNDSGGYLVRTIEIVKARYQSHVWGKHQLKIYENPQLGPSNEANVKDEKSDYRLNLRRHPYIKQGGLFIYPSIHWVLSRYKAVSPTSHDEDDYVTSPLNTLTDLLGKGFPRGRCTGLIGDRGTHKSHLGYLQVLSGLLQRNRKATESQRVLIVSLRDDEGTTRRTLSQIVGQHWGHKDGRRIIDKLEASGALEITYFPPGFITPEEFFHRLLLSINRLKANHANAHVSVLFNSLDQLSSRFPLCAQHRIFIPGIIEMLTAESITSYFVAAKDKETVDDYGLLSMAELILAVTRTDLVKEDYISYMNSLLPEPVEPSKKEELSIWEDRLDNKMGAVELSVVRFAGGEPAGAHGILELFKDDTEMSKLFGRRGLVFIPSKSRSRR